MANSVGSVSIDLEARIAKFESDLGRAARVAEQRSNEMRKTLGSVAAVLGVGISVAGITAWVKSAVDAQDAISKLSQKVGVSTESLSGWQLAAQQAGVENDSLQKGLVKLAQAADGVIQGSKTQVDAFKSIGVSVLESNGHLKSMDKLFVEVTDKMSHMADGTEKTVVATRLFGKAGADLIPMLNAGAKGLKEYAEMADAFGLTVGSKSAKAAEAFNDSMEQLSFVGKGLANVIATELSPALAELAAKTVDAFKGKAWHDWMDSVGRAALFVADNIDKIVTAFKVAGEVIASIYLGKLIRMGGAWVISLGVQAVAVVRTAAITTTAMNAMAAAPLKLVGLFGGLPAVLTQAAIATGYLMFKQTDAEKAASSLADTTDRLARAQGDVSESAIKQAQAQLEVERATLAEAKAHLAAISATRGYVTGAQNMDSMAVAAATASRGVEDLQVSIQKLEKQVQLSVIQKAFQDNMDYVARGARESADTFDALRKSLKDQQAQLAESVATFGKGKAAVLEYKEAQEIATIAADGDNNVTKARIATIKSLYGPTIALAKQLDGLTESQKAHTQALSDSKKAAEEEVRRIDAIAAAYAKLQGLNDTADGRNTDPVSKAWTDSAARIRAIADAGADLIKNGVDESRVHEVVEQSITKETAARDRALIAANKEMDTTGQLIQQLQQEAAMAGMSERNQFITRNGIQAETAYREKNVNATEDQIAAQRRLVEEAAGNAFDMEKIAQQQNQIAQEYAGFWENAASSIARSFGDLVTSGLRKWSDFGRSLKSIAQQFVSDIIAQFVRLRILGPLLSGAMGGVAGWLGIAGSLSGSSLSYNPNYAGGGGTIGTAAGAVGGSGGGAGYGGIISNISAAKNAYQWATGGFQLTGGTIVGGNSIVTAPSGLGGGGYGINMPGGSVVYGNGTTVSPYSPLGGSFTAGGYAVPYASIGGGLLGAYYGSQRGGGGFSTVASTVSYGALGAGIAGTAAGVAGGASLGAAAGGAFGAAAGMSWIPVVGWVLAAMALVDMVSGGKLFGTKYQTAASDATLRIGAEGGEASASLYQTKQRALFGGRKTRVVQQAVPQEMQDAADALYNSIAKSMVQGAQKLGVDVPAMIEASLNTHTTYNDKGQVRATEYVVDYLGRTWKEATAEAAAQRIGAEALVATVAASAGAVAQTIAEQWRKSADTLLDGAQTMLAAQVDINKGNSLIALGATATLSQVIKFVQGMQADGEKLADTYARVAAASAQYVQFVAQFAPVSAGFGASLQAINKQMQANLDQANALAQAAGMQHAAESDLANIHQFAAKQAADAIMQLSAAAQDLAAKLYNVTTNTLASVTAQIDKLQAKVQTAAQLAIGDKSPLSGKEKLDVALQGLRSGITSADDVLALGRKLYSSSADYAGLFAKVSEILQLPGATGQQSLTEAMTGYNALIGQRDQLAAQAAASQRFADAKTLAQYVADISTTHGISYGEAASGLGFSLNDLAKDLGLTNISGYLDSLEQQDVAGTTLTASANIVDAVRGIGHDIVQAILGGPLVQPGPVNTTSRQGPTEDQAALLAKLSAQVDVLIQHAESTAQSNGKMLDLDKSARLRDVTNSTRSATV